MLNRKNKSVDKCRRRKKAFTKKRYWLLHVNVTVLSGSMENRHDKRHNVITDFNKCMESNKNENKNKKNERNINKSTSWLEVLTDGKQFSYKHRS